MKLGGKGREREKERRKIQNIIKLTAVRTRKSSRVRYRSRATLSLPMMVLNVTQQSETNYRQRQHSRTATCCCGRGVLRPLVCNTMMVHVVNLNSNKLSEWRCLEDKGELEQVKVEMRMKKQSNVKNCFYAGASC